MSAPLMLSAHSSSEAGAHNAATTDPSWFVTARSVSVAASTVCVGLAAGFFFAFQISVTRGLAITDDVTYVNAFQSINATIRNTWFGIVFFGSIPVLSATIGLNRRADRRTLTLIAAAAVLYALTFAITAAGSVPLNDALAQVTDRSDSAVAAGRADYEASWNRLNMIRTITCVASLTCLAAIGLVARRRDQRPNT